MDNIEYIVTFINDQSEVEEDVVDNDYLIDYLEDLQDNWNTILKVERIDNDK